MKQDLLGVKKLIEMDYARKVKTFRALPIEKKNIMIGDSMVAYINLSQYGLDLINMGIAGDTTIGVIERLDAVLRIKPEIVFVNVGSNDLVLTHHSLEEIVLNIKRIFEKLSTFSKVYILSLTPVNESVEDVNLLYVGGRKNEDIYAINQKLRMLFKDCYIDTSDILKDESLKLNKAYTTDGIHLNHQGYSIWIEIIKNLVD